MLSTSYSLKNNSSLMDHLDSIIASALHEDIGDGDHTSLACIPRESTGTADLIAREECILSGVDIACRVFKKTNPQIKITKHTSDGTAAGCNDVIMTVKGPAISLLTAERVALNFMQRMSGIATHTHKLTNLLQGTHTRLLDTRKTTPNFRLPEKIAVSDGGGTNHRFGLYDMIMIKDNHIDFAGGIREAIKATTTYQQEHGKRLPVAIEARNMQEITEILQTGGVQRIMLDNFSPQGLREAVSAISRRYETEATGNITAKNIRAYAATGVDYISSGALTHHIKSIDISMKARY